MAVTISGSGTIDVGGTSTSQGTVRLYEDTDNGTNYVELVAPASVASNVTLTMPTTTGTVATVAGSDTQVIFNDGGSAYGGDSGLTYNKTTNTLSTDVYVASAGTASAPSITTTGDTNTGVFFPAADTAAISTGGTERLRVDSNGRLFVGDTSVIEDAKFEVVGAKFYTVGIPRAQIAAVDSTAIATGVGGAINFVGKYTGSTYTSFGSVEGYKENATDGNYAGSLVFKTRTNGGNQDERMRIDSSGNMLMGTTSNLAYSGLVFNMKSSGSYVGLNASSSEARVFATWDTTVIPMTFYIGGTERMRITSGGDVLVGTTSSGARFTVNGSTSDSTANSVSFRDSAGSALLYVRNDGRFVTGGSNSPYNATTSNAANCYIDSSGLFQRSTSSIKYKTQVENLEQAKADAILQLRPVWYRSLCQEDNQQWSWYGLIAEEVAVVEPRLVHWGYNQNDYEVVETDRFEDKTREVVLEDGTTATETYQEAVKEQRLKSDAVMSPEGVQYDRLTVLLLDVVKRQETRIAALEAKIDAQAARIAVLEAK